MMSRGMGLKAALCAAAVLLACALPAFAADGFIGEWATVTTVEGTDYPSDMKVWEENGELKVSVEDDLNGAMETSNAKIEGDTLTFEILVEALSPDPLQVTMTLKDGAITGTLASEFGDLPMAATAVGGGTSTSIAGVWDVIADLQGTEYPVVMTIVEKDGAIEVTIEDDINGVMPVGNVKLEGNALTYDITIDAIGPDPIPGKAMFDGDTFKGALEVADLGEITLVGTRAGGGIAGVWSVIANVAGDEYPVMMTIAMAGDGVNIAMEDDLNGEMVIEGAKLDGNTISFSVVVDALGPDPLPVTLTIDGDKFEGILDASASVGEIPLTGMKEGAGGGDAEAAIKEALDHFKVGMENKDTEEIGLALSDSFSHPEFGDKATMVTFLSDTFAGGDLDDSEIDLSGLEIKVDGDTATAYPAELMAAFGTLTIEFTLANEDGAWKVTTVEVEGL